jgi:hypothetical protein
VSKYQSEMTLDLSPSQSLMACHNALFSMGWSVEQYQNVLNCLQPQPWGDYNAQVRLQIAVIGQSTGGSKILLQGFNSGFGPLMTRYIKKQLEKMMK